MSAANAAVRRCHTVLLSTGIALAASVAAISALTPGQAAVEPAATVPEITVTAHAAPRADLPSIKPLAKPENLLALAAPPLPPAKAVAANEMTCLAEAVYYEARGETRDGQQAVAEVVIQRSRDKRYPGSICGVVYQDAHLRNSCQFSFACDGINHGRRDAKAWKRAVAVAEYELVGDGRTEDLTFGATHFHTVNVSPSWSKRFARTVRIGSHIFYRQPGTSYAGRGATS